MFVGMSCHDREEVARAEGADWIFLSPVFAVPSKGARPLGLEGFADLAAQSSSPAYALGGVDASNARACLEAGAAGIAAIRSLWGSGGEALIRMLAAHEPKVGS
jgi:thiamine-phosphate pyrophosphorylase